MAGCISPKEASCGPFDDLSNSQIQIFQDCKNLVFYLNVNLSFIPNSTKVFIASALTSKTSIFLGLVSLNFSYLRHQTLKHLKQPVVRRAYFQKSWSDLE